MLTLLFLGSIGLTEILVLLLIVLLLFGAKKIPELMKSFGKGVKSFKEGVNGPQRTAPPRRSRRGVPWREK